MTFEEAVTLLKKIVKESAIPGQKHLDLTLAKAEDVGCYEQALVVTNQAMAKGEVTREQLLKQLGLD